MKPSNGESRRLYFTLAAKINAKKLSRSHLRIKSEHLLNFIQEDPLKQKPPFEQLIGDLKSLLEKD